MSVKVANNRLIHSSLRGFYQHLTSSIVGFRVLGDGLINEAKRAQAFRQTETLEEIGSVLSNLPLEEYRMAGQYYLAWCINRRGGDAQNLFEQVAEQSTLYRPMALIELGSGEAKKGNFDLGIRYYAEAIKYSHVPYTIVLAGRSIAAIKGMEGHHAQAVKDLEQFTGLVKYTLPIEKYQYLNSLAVELVEVRRIAEARNICRVVLNSPYASAYPEWRETHDEVRLRGYKLSRSFVSLARNNTPKNLVRLPEREPELNPQPEPARILNYMDWKNKMVKDSKSKDEIDSMDDKELLLKIIEVVSDEGLTENELRQILKLALRLSPKRD